MDIAISNWVVETFGKNKAFAIFVRVVTELGSFWAIATIIALLLCFKKTRKLGIYSLVVCLICWSVNELAIKNIVRRERPFVQDESLSVMCELAKMKFPVGFSMASGHSLATMCLCTTVIYFYGKKSLPIILYPVIIGLSRVFLCVHFLSDVLVGWFIGCVPALLLCIALTKIERKINQSANKTQINAKNKK